MLYVDIRISWIDVDSGGPEYLPRMIYFYSIPKKTRMQAPWPCNNWFCQGMDEGVTVAWFYNKKDVRKGCTQRLYEKDIHLVKSVYEKTVYLVGMSILR